MGAKGRNVTHGGGDDLGPERALLAAILLLAIRDARGGDAEAAAWLAETGASWADCFLDVLPETFARWADRGERGQKLRLHTANKQAARARRYDEEHRARKRTYDRARRAAARAATGLTGGLFMTVTARTHYRDGRGFVIELTMTGETGAELLPGVSKTLDVLMQQGCKPVDPFTEPTAAEVARNLSRAQLAKSTPGQGPGGRLFADK